MAARKHIIIGSGAAGLSALEKIRSITPEGEVKIVSREDSLPYSPAALPALIAGKVGEKQMMIRGEDYFGRLKSSLVKGKEVVAIEPDRKQVIYRGGEAESYDTLLIACGSEPAMPALPGLQPSEYLGLRTMEDYRRLMRELQGRSDVTIYGGGLVATELATSLVEKGLRVRLIVRSRLLRAYFDEELGSFVEQILRSRGAQFLIGSEVVEVRRPDGKGRTMELCLSDGSRQRTEVFVVALGVKAKTSLAETCGIKTNRGIVVDRKMKTNIADVYAAGDVAETANFFTGEPGMNPILPSAVTQGEVAGANMAGENAEYEGWIPRNAFVFFGNRAFSVGLAIPPKNYEVMKEKNDSTKQLKKLVYDGNRLVGGVFLNHDVDPGVVQYLIKKKLDIGPHKRLLFERPKEISQWLMSEAERRGSALSAARS